MHSLIYSTCMPCQLYTLQLVPSSWYMQLIYSIWYTPGLIGTQWPQKVYMHTSSKSVSYGNCVHFISSCVGEISETLTWVCHMQWRMQEFSKGVSGAWNFNNYIHDLRPQWKVKKRNFRWRKNKHLNSIMCTIACHSRILLNAMSKIKIGYLSPEGFLKTMETPLSMPLIQEIRPD